MKWKWIKCPVVNVRVVIHTNWNVNMFQNPQVLNDSSLKVHKKLNYSLQIVWLRYLFTWKGSFEHLWWRWISLTSNSFQQRRRPLDAVSDTELKYSDSFNFRSISVRSILIRNFVFCLWSLYLLNEPYDMIYYWIPSAISSYL